jgi:hypothetical protein
MYPPAGMQCWQNHVIGFQHRPDNQQMRTSLGFNIIMKNGVHTNLMPVDGASDKWQTVYVAPSEAQVRKAELIFTK